MENEKRKLFGKIVGVLFVLVLVGSFSKGALAAVWDNRNFTPEGVRAWLDAGFRYPEDAKAWHDAGFTPNDAGAWADAFGITSKGRRGRAHAQTQLLAVAAKAWRDADFTPGDAGVWADAIGRQCVVQMACRIYNLAQGGYLKYAEAWRNAGFSPIEAKPWNDAGISPEIAKPWRNAGVSPETAKPWSAAGFTPDAAKPWSDTGFSADTAKAWNDAGFTPDGAKPWSGAGFTPDNVSDLRKAGFTLAEASKWHDAGYSVSDSIRLKKAGNTLAGLLRKQRAKEKAERAAEKAKRVAMEAKREKRKQYLHTNCPDGVFGVNKFVLTNPYDVQGMCFKLSGQLLQLLNRETALYNLGGYTFYVDFSPESAPRYFMNRLLKGDDAFKYTAVDGSMRTVPALSPVPPSSGE